MEVKTKSEFVSITEAAKSQITSVIESQSVDNLFLRIYVQGGCGGIQYGMAIDSRLQEGDEKYDLEGLDLVVDRISLPYVDGVTVDFETSGEKPGFRITNPNPEILAGVGGGCSCGSSSGGCGGGSCGTGGCC